MTSALKLIPDGMLRCERFTCTLAKTACLARQGERTRHGTPVHKECGSGRCDQGREVAAELGPAPERRRGADFATLYRRQARGAPATEPSEPQRKERPMRAVETPKPVPDTDPSRPARKPAPERATVPATPSTCKCGCGRALDPLRNRSGWSGYCNAAKQRSGDRASRVWTPEKLSDAALAELWAQVQAEVQRRRAVAQATLQALSGDAG